MPVEKNKSGFRARLKVRQQRYDGPTRETEAEAENDLRRLQAVRAESSDVVQSVLKELHGSGSSHIERRGETFRARVKKDGHTYVGPNRLSEAEAKEDAEQLSNTAAVSLIALEEMERSLAAPDDSLAQVVLEAMHCWLREGTTARLRGVSRVLRTRIRRAAPDSDQGRVFQAAQKLVQSHLLTEAVAMDVTAGWLQELGLQWRLDSGSRPRGTAGFEQAAGQTESL